MSHAIGRLTEAVAEHHLMRLGWRTLARNFCCRGGEIDLVMTDGDTVVFVEVRARAMSTYGDPLETISSEKARRIILAARHYRMLAQDTHPCRFDIVLLRGEDVEHIINAFDLSDVYGT